MGKEVIFSSNSDQWDTPQCIFDELDKEFNFTLDPCADVKTINARNFLLKMKMVLYRIGGDASVLQPTLWKRNISMD